MHHALPNTTTNTATRAVAAAVILAWFGWIAACPDALLGVERLAAAPPEHAHDGAIGDVCCAELQHLVATTQVHAIKLPTLAPVVLPSPVVAIVGALARDAAAVVIPGFVHGPPPRPRRSVASGPHWPHAPPR